MQIWISGSGRQTSEKSKGSIGWTTTGIERKIEATYSSVMGQ
jgi:hypothetical protein